jgi:hypothetical protein
MISLSVTSEICQPNYFVKKQQILNFRNYGFAKLLYSLHSQHTHIYVFIKTIHIYWYV